MTLTTGKILYPGTEKHLMTVTEALTHSWGSASVWGSAATSLVR